MQYMNDYKHRILVSGASGIVGYGILRCLKERGDSFLIGTTIYNESPANCFSDEVVVVPKTNDPDYLECLLSIISKYSIDMIIPSIEADMSYWNKNIETLKSTGVTVLINNSSLVNLCLDKWSFYEKLVEINYNGRINSSLDHEYGKYQTPFILKPRCGYGSKGLIKIESKDQYNKYINEIGRNLIMQELVGTDDEEYTVSVFFDYNSKIVAGMGLKRKLSKSGYTEIAETTDLEPFLNDIKVLAETFKPIGPTNFQFRKHKNALKLLEINPRISSSTSIRCKFGYNESSMAVDYFLEKKEIEQPIIKKGKATRYIEDYIIYDSDYFRCSR